MANWFCFVFNVVCMCRKRLSSSRCRSELIDFAWVFFVTGEKCIKNNKIKKIKKNSFTSISLSHKSTMHGL